ncbi:hypothetical protein CL614_09570 [archaeon]|jgi:phage baseplate assembly protein W|nr:hypothetical protein [archaeon]|tara:strand:- start:1021 stop:1506 length:486 start_codon:yes stop_codon:yes gene_type:complete
MPQNFKEYGFKSVGQTAQDIAELNPDITGELPIGIKTPVQFGPGTDGLFQMHKDLKKSVADNFRNLLLTNHGERVGLFNFGANLRELVFELGTEDVDSEAMKRVSQAVQAYMPFIQLKEFIPFTDLLDNEVIGKKGITITYSVPDLGAEDLQIKLTLYVAG